MSRQAARTAGGAALSSRYTATSGASIVMCRGYNWAQQVSAALVDEKKSFKRFKVTADVDIQTFVNAQLKGKGTYEKGRGFYELTKSETVQGGKDIAIVDKKGAIFTGPAARDLLGLPTGASCTVKPGDHGDFSIFIASTSLNRKLVKGTELLYRG